MLAWCSPSGRDKNKIDLLMINGTWRRGDDVGSDRHLVTATILKLRKNGPGKARQQQFDVKKLKEPKAGYLHPPTEEQVLKHCGMLKTYTAQHEQHQHHMEADQSIRVPYAQTRKACLERSQKRKEWMIADTW